MLECSTRCAGYCKVKWNLETILVFHLPLFLEEPAYLITVGVSDHRQSLVAFETALEHEILPYSRVFIDVR